MPTIREYQQTSQVIGPADTREFNAEHFGAASGSAVEKFGNQLSQVGEVIKKNQESQEVSDLNAKFADVHAQYTNEFQKQLQDGTLDSTKFMDNFNDNVQNLSDGIQTAAGQRHFNELAATYQSHFAQTAIAGSAQLAGEKAKNDYAAVLDKSSSALLNDPSSFDVAKQLHDQTIDSLVEFSGLPARHADDLRTKGTTELAKSAVEGWIRLNPSEAQQQLNSGKWDEYFNGDVKKQLYGEADQAIRGRTAEDLRAQKLKQDEMAAAQTATQNQFLDKMQQGQLSAKDVLQSNLDPFGSGSKEQFIKMIETSNKEAKITTDPDTFTRIFQDIHSGKITDENALNEYMGHGLTLENIVQLRNELKGKGTQAGDAETILKRSFFSNAQAQIAKPDPVTKLPDPQGAANYQKFLSQALTDYDTGRKAGKTPAELLTPGKLDYIGNTISNYQRTPQQIMQDMIKGRGNPNSVEMLLPDGSTALIPKENVDKAKARGARVK